MQQQIDELLAKAREKHRSAQVSIDDVGAATARLGDGLREVDHWRTVYVDAGYHIVG